MLVGQQLHARARREARACVPLLARSGRATGLLGLHRALAVLSFASVLSCSATESAPPVGPDARRDGGASNAVVLDAGRAVLAPASDASPADAAADDGGAAAGFDAGIVAVDSGASDSGPSGPDSGPSDASDPEAGGPDRGPRDSGVSLDAGASFERVPVNVPAGHLCSIPADYVANGGDPTYVPCDVEADRLSDRDPAAPAPASIHIATWNVRFGVEADEIERTIAAHPDLARADVLLLSEVARDDLESNPQRINQARRIALARSMDYVFAVEWDRRENPTWQGEHGVAILSKLPIGNVTQIRHIALNDWYEETRRYGGRITLGADLLAGSTRVRVYSSHLDTRPRFPDDSGRARQAAEIRADADRAERPRIQLLGGDLNTWTCNPLRSDCTRAPGAETLIQDLLAAGWSDGTAGFNGFTQLGEGFFPQRLDWLFYRGAGATPGTLVEPSEGSDHLPLSFTLMLP